MSTHAKVTDIVKEDHARGSPAVLRFAEERADYYIRTTRLTNDSGTDVIVPGSKPLHPNSHRPRSKVGSATDDGASRLAAGMRVNYVNSFLMDHWVQSQSYCTLRQWKVGPGLSIAAQKVSSEESHDGVERVNGGHPAGHDWGHKPANMAQI
jgi:hypothetical protein